MNRYLKALVFVLVCGTAVSVFAYVKWRKGIEYQDPSWSPNHQYYSQKYQTFSFSTIFAPAMPGQGSDNINGFIRIYDKNGKLLHERYYTFIRDIKTEWSGNEVYFLAGRPDSDNDIMKLPGNAE